MHIVQFVLERADRRPGPASPMEAALIEDVLWAHADPLDGVQHIRVRGEPGGTELHLLLAESLPDPVQAAADFVGTSGRASGYLKAWRFIRPG